MLFSFFSSARHRGAQSIAGSAHRHGRDTRMSRGILSEIYQLLGQKSDENADGRVRLYLIFGEENKVKTFGFWRRMYVILVELVYVNSV